MGLECYFANWYEIVEGNRLIGVVVERARVLPKRLLLKGFLFCCGEPLVSERVRAKSVIID